jgi:hypothetical protein
MDKEQTVLLLNENWKKEIDFALDYAKREGYINCPAIYHVEPLSRYKENPPHNRWKLLHIFKNDEQAYRYLKFDERIRFIERTILKEAKYKHLDKQFNQLLDDMLNILENIDYTGNKNDETN